MNDIELSLQNLNIDSRVELPKSKSISNRLLILEFLYRESFDLSNLSTAKDTLLLKELLEIIKDNDDLESEVILDCKNAGTVIRFLTACLSFTSGVWILTANKRMQQRPIKPLVDALKSLNVNIDYLEKEGFPPLRILGSSIHTDVDVAKVSVNSSLSSQFVSALMLCANLFPKGLHIELIGERKVSKPYIQITAEILRDCGAEVVFIDGSNIFVNNNIKKPHNISIEGDWTAASYFYGILALLNGGKINIPALYADSIQGDAILLSWFEKLGVKTSFATQSATLSKDATVRVDKLRLDFTHYPDLFPTMAVCCAALGVETNFTGLDTLSHKECDRLEATITELRKLGANIVYDEIIGDVCIQKSVLHTENILINTYDDHRMAMAFSILGAKYNSVYIENKDVVEKSFPNYWKELEKIGFEINEYLKN